MRTDGPSHRLCRLWHKLRMFQMGRAGGFRYGGQRVFAPPGCHLYERILEDGDYEHDTAEWMFRGARDQTWVFDVGANIGLMALPLLARNPTVRVVSFEPSPNAAPYLRRTVAASPFADRWSLRETALGETGGEVEFCVSGAANAAFDGMVHTRRVPCERRITVPCSTVDQEWQALGRPEVSLIKVDVEGAELRVLRGARDCLQSRRPMIVTEWSRFNYPHYGHHAGELLEFAQAHGYHLYSLPRLWCVQDAALMAAANRVCGNFLLSPQ
ncbi:MAG: FkbM family methyltransferase [Lentisphaeria bacterium]